MDSWMDRETDRHGQTDRRVHLHATHTKSVSQSVSWSFENFIKVSVMNIESGVLKNSVWSSNKVVTLIVSYYLRVLF
jgi:hypothetical protein